MTIERKIPQQVDVAQGQVTNGVTAVNNADKRIESAAFGYVDVAIDSTTETLTSAQFWEGSFFRLIAGSPVPGGAVTLNVPAEERGPFVVANDCGETVTLKISGLSPTQEQTIQDGFDGHFVSDGSNIYRTSPSTSGITHILEISQAAYDLLTPDAGTLYVITS